MRLGAISLFRVVIALVLGRATEGLGAALSILPWSLEVHASHL